MPKNAMAVHCKTAMPWLRVLVLIMVVGQGSASLPSLTCAIFALWVVWLVWEMDINGHVYGYFRVFVGTFLGISTF